MTNQEIGWSDDVTGRAGKLSHFYVDGKSLCGKWELRHYMKVRDKDLVGSKSTMCCTICEKRRSKLNKK